MSLFTQSLDCFLIQLFYRFLNQTRSWNLFVIYGRLKPLLSEYIENHWAIHLAELVFHIEAGVPGSVVTEKDKLSAKPPDRLDEAA